MPRYDRFELLPREPSVVLWGPPGAGKTTVGRLVASTLGRPFFDTDAQVATQAGRSVEEIFRVEGEAAFRSRERDAVRACLAEPGAVVALGGGTLVDRSLREEVLGRAVVVRLVAPLATLRERTASSRDRPLLAGPSGPAAALDRLIAERADAYRSGHLAVDASAAPEVIAEVITRRLRAGLVPLFVPPHAYGAFLAEGDAAAALGAVLQAAEASSVHAVVDETVHSLFGSELLEALPVRPRSVHLVGPGERAKSFSVLERVMGELLEAGVDRNSIVIALGGGATTDLAGLAAGLLARGVRWIAVPTTLLSMVDASVGGKTAINLGAIKNPVGLFHHPCAVLVDPTFTASEPERGFRAALAELVKTALIGDAASFEAAEADPQRLLARDPSALRDAVFRALRVKASVVVADPDERGVRAVLNLGHTVGHAIEADSAGNVSHGEAVAMGLEAALELGVERGVTPATVRDRVVSVLRTLGLPALAPLTPGALSRLRFDKKRRGAAVQLVLLREVGAAEIVSVSLDELQASLRKLGHPSGLP